MNLLSHHVFQVKGDIMNSKRTIFLLLLLLSISTTFLFAAGTITAVYIPKDVAGGGTGAPQEPCFFPGYRTRCQFDSYLIHGWFSLFIQQTNVN